MNWHEPLITPAMAFYCFIGVIVIDVLYLVARKAMKDSASAPDQHEMLTADWERRHDA